MPLPAFLPPLPLSPHPPHVSRSPRIKTLKASLSNHTTLLQIPTGIAAAIGGYAGDALPVARVLASVTDTLITHPNVLNAASLYYPIPNALYVEGFSLDKFLAGQLTLHPRRKGANKIGVILDSAISTDLQIRHMHVVNAARASLGLQIQHVLLTDQPVGVELQTTHVGASWGTITNPHTLLRAAETLVRKGVDAIAVVANFPDEDEQMLEQYRAGSGVDAIAGAEAVISHLISNHFHLPVAHAPALPPLPADDSVSPKACAEELGYTFLSCVLVNLSQAPHLKPAHHTTNAITSDDVDVAVIPSGCWGGGVMHLHDRALIIAVDNPTAMNLLPQDVGIDTSRIVYASSYAEAIGMVAAHRQGVSLESLSSHIHPLTPQLDTSQLTLPTPMLHANQLSAIS